MSQSGLWMALYSAALSGLCASKDNDTMGAEGIAHDAATVADEAVKVVLSRMMVLNEAARAEEEK